MVTTSTSNKISTPYFPVAGRKTMKFLITVILSVGLLGLTVAHAPNAEAALPKCNGTLQLSSQPGNYFVYSPASLTYSNGNPNDSSCAMSNPYSWSGGVNQRPNNCAQNTPRCNPVLTLQWAYKTCYRGYSGFSDISADGNFGPGTANALKFMQKIEGITQDGVYGNQSRDFLEFPVYRYTGSGLYDTQYVGLCRARYRN